MAKLHLAPAVGDDQLEPILKRIAAPEEKPIAHKSEFQSFVTKRTAADEQVLLDIVGHGDCGRLWCDTFHYDAGTVAALFPGSSKPVIAPEKHRFTAIRLLGCDTASFAVGLQAMHRLHRIFGVPVWGTRTALHAEDYGPEGLLDTRGNLMVVPTPSKIAPKDPEEAVADWSRHLPPARMWRPLTDRRHLLTTLRPQSARSPFAPPKRHETFLSRDQGRILTEQILTAPWIALAQGLQVRTSHVFWLPLPAGGPSPRRWTVARIDALGHYPAMRLYPDLRDERRGYTAIVPTTHPLDRLFV